MPRLRNDWSIFSFAILTGIVYGIIFTAQVLGMIGMYKVWLALPLTILISASAAWLYLQFGGRDFLAKIFSQPSRPAKNRLLDTALLVCGAVIVLLLIILPTAAWPYSPISETLTWDAGLYHFPKALELVRTGSALDLTIAYGEYPFGFESLFAFGALLTRGESLFGTAQMLGCLYMVFSLWFVIRRFSGLPAGLTLFLSSVLLTVGTIAGFESNFWGIFQALIYTVGKNDLFLGAAVLAAILHAPLGSRENQASFFPLGLALTTMIAVATKPNAIPVLLPVWLWTIYCSWIRPGTGLNLRLFPWKILATASLVVMPGLLWAIRNLAIQGALFEEDAAHLQDMSIAANLTNPYFYQNIPNMLTEIGLILILSVVLAAIFKHVTWSAVAIIAVLLIGFALTPVSAYFGPTNSRPDIAWRFGVGLLAFSFILPLMWFVPLIKNIYHWVNLHAVLAAASVVVFLVFCAWFILPRTNVLQFRASNAIVLRDQFRQSVGSNGYFSAYDYVQRNVQNSVVWVENGLPYYVYGPGITNSTTRSVKSNYTLILQTNFDGGDPGYPAYTSDPNWQKGFQLVYEDSQGRVYKRLK